MTKFIKEFKELEAANIFAEQVHSKVIIRDDFDEYGCKVIEIYQVSYSE